jgi:hypothetical protein
VPTDPWAGVDLKVRHAAFFLGEMSGSLQPRPMSLAQQSTGAVIDTAWQRSFYAYLDAFLAIARSIPEIINYCFGEDKIKPIEGADQEEKTRRKAFSDQFELHHKKFREHPLSNERNISFHRAGYPSVEVTIAGRFGLEHIGSPVKPVPSAESPRFGDPGNDPALQWAATQAPFPVQPMWSDFTIDGKPLFVECRTYLTIAQQLADHARSISQRVHGSSSLTPPPA